MQMRHPEGKTNMASMRTRTAVASQAAAKAMLTDMNIAMANCSPFVQVESSLSPAAALPAPRSELSAVRAEPVTPAAERADQPAFPPLTTQVASLFQEEGGRALVSDPY